MLALMRDPKVPTDLRLEMAVAAAPFMHAKPQAPSRVRTNPMDLSPIKSSVDFTGPKMEGELSAPEQGGEGGGDLSPLNFLLGVMKDPDATPKQRIKAARVAARYKHVPLPPDKMPAVDEYGFSISRTLAKTIGDDWLRLKYLESGTLGAVSANYVNEAAQIRARQAERDEFLQCPPGYSSERDSKRYSELIGKWRRNELSMAEKTELAHVIARITASQARFNLTPEGRARDRLAQLQAKSWMLSAGRAKFETLSPAEQSEMESLLQRFYPILSWSNQRAD